MKRPEYLYTLENAYPFHPVLLDILYERVSTIPEFHLTRGLLRLVSLIIKDVLNTLPEEPVIMPYHINLINEDIFHELTHKLQRGNLAPVVRADIVNAKKDAKAQLIDRNPCLTTRTATCLFLFSLIGNGKKDEGIGAGINDVNVCVSLPGSIHPSDVADVLHHLHNRLWYLHERSGYYYFDTERNINKLIDDTAHEMTKPTVDAEIKARLHHLVRGDFFAVYVWEPPGEVDYPVLALLYFDVTATHKVPETVQTLIDRTGTSYRVNKNVMYVLVAREEYADQVQRVAARYLAIKELKEDQNVSEMDKIKLNRKYKEENKALNEILELAYSVVYYAQKNETKRVRVQDIKTPASIQQKVYAALLKEGKITEELSPYFITDRVLTKEAERFGDVYKKFLQAPALPYIREKQVLVDAVKAGVLKKHFGLWVQSFVPVPEQVSPKECHYLYYGRTVPSITDACYIVSPKLAEQILDQCKPFKKDTTPQKRVLTQIKEISDFNKKGTLLKNIRVYVDHVDRLSTTKQLLNNVYVGSDAQFTFCLTEESISFQVTALEHSHLMDVFEVLRVICRKILRKEKINLVVTVSSNLVLEEEDINDFKEYLEGVHFVAEVMQPVQ
jgi:hypothetical protein